MTDGPARRNLLVQQGTNLLQKQAEIAKYFISTQVGDQDKQQAYIQAINQGLQEQQKLLRANAQIEDMRLRVVRENFAASYQAQMDQLKLKLKDTTFSEGLAIGFRKVSRDMETFAQTGARIAQTTSTLMTNTFQQFFFDLMEGRLKSLDQYFSRFFNSVASAMMQLAAQQAAKGLSNLVISGIGSLFAAEKGGVIPGPFVPLRRFQSGGIVSRPTFGLIAEGPRNEAVVPLPDNRSIPVIFPQAGQTQTAIAPNVQVQINVTNQGPALDMKVVNQQMTQNKQGQAKLILDVVTYGVMTNPGLRAALKSV